MIRTIKLIALIGIFSSGVQGQTDSMWNLFPNTYKNPFRTVKQGNFLSVDADLWINSSTANNDILRRIYFKQDLDNETIQSNADDAKAKNLIGSETSWEVNYAHLSKPFLKKDSLHWTLKYGFRDHTGVSYSDVLFKLIAQGNKQYEGDTADASGFDFFKQRFDYFEFGVIKYFPNRSNLSVAVGPARGMRISQVTGQNFLLYTEPYGTGMFWDVDVNAKLTSGRQAGLDQIHGMGMTASAEYNGMLTPKGSYSVGIKNFGFVSWESNHYMKDDTFHYYGWNLPSWSDFNNPNAGQQAYDSIENIFKPTIDSNERSVEWLPAYVHADYTMLIGKKSALNFRYDQVLFTEMLPRFTVGYTYFGKCFYSKTDLAFGGYGRLNLNESVGMKFKKHYVAVRAYGLEAWVTPKISAGFGAGLSYAYSF